MGGMEELLLRPISSPVDRTIRLPGSKSLTNRALLIAALAGGESDLRRVLFADDTILMMEALGRLGVAVTADRQRRRARLRGIGGRWPEGTAELDCGNAGTVIRFLTAACTVGTGTYRLDGVARMRQRPIGDLVRALGDLGASIDHDIEEGFCPLTVHAAGLPGGQTRLDAPQSSQFVSALLMAAPIARRDVMIDVSGPVPSLPYVRMTLSVMETFGVSVIQDGVGRFIVPAPQSYVGTSFEIEPDASSASYFLAAAALTGGRITVDGLGRGSIQGDAAFVDVLEEMGCRVERSDHDTTVFGPPAGRLRGVDVDLNAMPDVAQTLAVLAAFAEGPTRIRNVANLRIKETDRLAALATELARLGIETQVFEDGITVRPTRSPAAATIETYDDHRMAMSFALAGLRTEGVRIRNPGCVAKTVPEFFHMWSELG